MTHWLQQKLNRIWYQQEKSWWNILLIPLSFLYAFLLRIRALRKSNPYRSQVPVVVVGNLTVGGSGKTPAILALIQLLQSQGKSVGVVSRGYPVNPKHPILLNSTTSADDVGDEPLLIYQKTQVPVCVCKNRVAAIQVLEKKVDVILSDDGLQNFSFHHDKEIVIVDSERQFGNEKLLPAGPLREPLARLASVDFLVEKISPLPLRERSREARVRGNFIAPSLHQLSLAPQSFQNLSTHASAPPEYFHHKKVIAITAIASPESFFQTLENLGLFFEPHAFCDHYAFQAKDFEAFKDAEILMTEKDAVKCQNFADAHFWTLPLVGRFSGDFIEQFKL